MDKFIGLYFAYALVAVVILISLIMLYLDRSHKTPYHKHKTAS
jgi:hypothetical protein